MTPKKQAPKKQAAKKQTARTRPARKQLDPARLSLQTRAMHAGDDLNPLASVSPPIVQSATFELGTVARGAALSSAVAPADLYTRWGNPTTKMAEAVLASLEGGEAALVMGSGMGAISCAVLSRLAAGDHVVAGRSLYAASTELMAELLPRFGVEASFVDQTDPDAVEAAIRPATRLLHVETITNPTLQVADLDRLAAIARRAGVTSIIDNTFATPVLARPLEHGFDLVVHSLTKYLNGHSDVIGGAVIGSRPAIDRVWYHMKILGPSASPFEAWLLLRGLRTLGLRMERHCRNAMAVARFLAAHPKVERVHYPGLEDHPQHELARGLLRGGFGGMVSFELRGGVEAGRRCVESLELVKLAVSLGGAESLVNHAASTTHTMIPPAGRRAAGISDGLIRLSVGLEDEADLIADLAQALARS
jgi:methionine-gamma-lyase